MSHTAIILIALGGPRSLDEVGPFMAAFMGRPAPPPVVAAVIERYKLIGGKSPLPELVKAQADALEKELGSGFRAYEGFRYSNPTVAESFDKAITDGARRVIALSMSPFSTEVTTGAYKSACDGLGSGETCPLFIPSWHDNPLFIEAWEERVFRRSRNVPGEHYAMPSSSSSPATASRSAISLPAIPIRSRSRRRSGWSLQKLGVKGMAHCLAEQGRAGDRALDRARGGADPGQLAQEGHKAVLEVPIGFTCDHMETLYDIDIVHRKHAEAWGSSFERAESLNTSPLFIKALADVVKKLILDADKRR